jgi:DNA-binding winged helix-turn-helix (wHTH) protein
MTLRWGEFELDAERFELRKSGACVPVQPKVLDLVLYLAKNRERVVGKDELLEEVWKGIAVTEASLSQAVSLARRAVDDTPEAQHTIRTVRSRGFHFVAELATEAQPEPAWSSAPVSSGVPRQRRQLTELPALGSSAAETREEDLPASRPAEVEFLFVLLHAELPSAGGARYSLAEVDEVLLTRSSTRAAGRSGAITRLLELRFPGTALSRDHAKLVRTREGWMLTDESSKNGSFVNGERVRRRALSNGDVLRCGGTHLWFQALPGADDGDDIDSAGGLEAPFTSVTPGLRALGRDLVRIGKSALPILFLGESGVGKERTSRAVHRFSERAGRLVVLDAGARASESGWDREGGMRGALQAASGGTLVVEHVDHLNPEAQAALVRAIDEQSANGEVRFIATSTLAHDALAGHPGLRADLLTRLAGFRCTIPPLRQRLGDLGCLVADLLAELELPALELDGRAAEALVRHGWPGNVRELSQCLKTAATLAPAGCVRLQDLPPHLR